MIFANRTEAGELLAQSLSAYANREDVIVFALPRGGVPVAYEVATRLHLPLDVFIVRKLGAPWQPELAMGAIAMGGVRVLNEDLVRQLGVSEAEIAEVEAREQQELQRRMHLYRNDTEIPDLHDKTILLIDDGVATGATIKAAIMAIQHFGCAKLIVAVPVAPPETIAELNQQVDQVICLHAPSMLMAIGNWYQDFSQTSSEEVQQLLASASEQLKKSKGTD